MKNMTKLLGIIALVAVIGFGVAGCESPIDEPAHVHQWSAWDVTLAANCTTAGSQTRTCTLDATHTETEAIPINDDHDWGEWEGTVTCTEGGTGTRVCSRSATHTQTDNNLQPLGHNYQNWKTTTLSTCTTAGEEKGTCTRDQVTTTRTVPIDPTNHDWQISSGTAPTCTEDGNGVEICSYNNEHTRSGILPKLGHEYQNWQTTTPSTCTTEGVETGTCTRDQVTATRPKAIDPTAHNYNTWKQTTAPTCEAAGIESLVCAYNNAHTSGSTRAGAAALGHDWNTAYSIISTVSESTDGVEAITCKNDPAHTKDERITYATGTEGLAFELINDGGDNDGTYRVSKGTVTSTSGKVLYIPAYHRPDENSDYKPVTEIGSTSDGNYNGAFYYTYYTAVNIPEGITAIGANAFLYCDYLASVTIPASVTTIGTDAFSGCNGLSTITVAANNPNFSSEGYILYNKEKTAISFVLTGISGNITLPATLTSIGDRAFSGRSGITSITIPAGSIGDWAFSGCSGLTSVTIGTGVTTIGEGTFRYCTSLTSVTISDSVTTIGMQAFQDCTGLTTITIPAGVTAIGDVSGIVYYSAFQGCTNLRNIIIDNDKLIFNVSSDTRRNNFHAMFPTDNLSVTFKKNVVGNAFYSISANNRLTSVTFEEGVTSIANQAFQNCAGLTSITIPANVTAIGEQAFYGCAGLTSVTFAGTIANASFGNFSPQYTVFPGDLRTKFYQDNSANGVPGTYTRSGSGTTQSPYVWTRQP